RTCLHFMTSPEEVRSRSSVVRSQKPTCSSLRTTDHGLRTVRSFSRSLFHFLVPAHVAEIGVRVANALFLRQQLRRKRLEQLLSRLEDAPPRRLLRHAQHRGHRAERHPFLNPQEEGGSELAGQAG